MPFRRLDRWKISYTSKAMRKTDAFAKEKASYFNEYVKEYLNSDAQKLKITFITKSRYDN